MGEKCIEDMTVKQVRELCALVEGRRSPRKSRRHPYKIGEKYFIRTVTFYYTGRLVEVYGQELVLEDVCWVADTGRYNKALASGQFNELEPYPPGSVIIGRGAIIDACVWKFDLPRSEK